jgi:hypothetical protein
MFYNMKEAKKIDRLLLFAFAPFVLAFVFNVVSYSFPILLFLSCILLVISMIWLVVWLVVYFKKRKAFLDNH